MSLIARSASRVSGQTAGAINERIRRKTEANLAYFARHPEQIDGRLSELDREWDTERCLETGTSCLSLFGMLMGATRSRKWFLLPLVVQGFFLQHGVQGWCPPLPVFRRLGVRTQGEIESERYALKALRGDFEPVERSGNAEAVTEAVEGEGQR